MLSGQVFENPHPTKVDSAQIIWKFQCHSQQLSEQFYCLMRKIILAGFNVNVLSANFAFAQYKENLIKKHAAVKCPTPELNTFIVRAFCGSEASYLEISLYQLAIALGKWVSEETELLILFGFISGESSSKWFKRQKIFLGLIEICHLGCWNHPKQNINSQMHFLS